jgi:hypothetical protein
MYGAGYVWSPLVQFVYWGLKAYDSAPSVRPARLAMVNQMQAMFMEQWRLNHYVCENYSPFKVRLTVDPTGAPCCLRPCSTAHAHTCKRGTQNATDCTGGQFYTWGALAALLPFLEQGYW